MTDRKDIIKPIGFHRESTALNDTDMKYLLLYLEETYGLTNAVSYTHLANMSKEGKHISMDTLARICETLNCEITDVIELVSCLLYTSRCV